MKDSIYSGRDRTYRNLVQKNKDDICFRVAVKETDLFIHAKKHLEDIARESILKYRGYIESYISWYPDFAATLHPWIINNPAPLIVQDMTAAGEKAGVGPMAAVAGAIAEYVGNDILEYSDEVIVENGGDIFLKKNGLLTIGIFAGNSPLSLNIGLRINSGVQPISICTSSGTVGHSLSFGKADAACIIADSCPLADALATAIGNRIKTQKDIQNAIDFGKNINGIKGIVIIIGNSIGAWGELELVPLDMTGS